MFDVKGENMFNAKTIDEIQEHFPDLPVIDIWVNKNMFFLKCATYDNALMFLHEGRISPEYFEGYCAIWRNLIAHYSSVAISYEF